MLAAAQGVIDAEAAGVGVGTALGDGEGATVGSGVGVDATAEGGALGVICAVICTVGVGVTDELHAASNKIAAAARATTRLP
jgi:hypothetical protein